MSVYYRTIVLLGWQIGTNTYKEFDPDDGWENELEQEYGFRDAETGDVVVVYDGRGGRYCYFGEILEMTNSTRNGPQSFDTRVMIDGDVSAETADALQEETEEAGLDVSSRPTYHIFTHVT